MIYFLDTNTCIHALEGEFRAIQNRMTHLLPERIKIPSMVVAELLFGAAKSSDPDKVRKGVEEFLLPYETVGFGAAEAAVYAGIRADLQRRGMLIGPNDLVIAATTLAHGATLVTRNRREFGRVAGLAVEDWTQ